MQADPELNQNAPEACKRSHRASHPEQAAIIARRDAWQLDHSPSPIGLALSGGGIRSATFSLGVLRELSALNKLHHFDYLSTVSGGSYIGAFFCGLFVPRLTGELGRGSAAVKAPATHRTEADQATPDPLGSAEAQKAIDLLRQSGRYLAPTGSTDYWYAAALLLRNWIGLHIVLGSAIFGAGLLGVWLRRLIVALRLDPWAIWTVWLGPLGSLSIGPVADLALIAAGIHLTHGWCYWLTRRDVGSRGGRGTSALIGSYLLTLSCTLCCLIFHFDLGFGIAALIGAVALVQFTVAAKAAADEISKNGAQDDVNGADFAPPVVSARPRPVKDISLGSNAGPSAPMSSTSGPVSTSQPSKAHTSPSRSAPSTSIETAWDRQRTILTRRQAKSAKVTLGLIGFAIVDGVAFRFGSPVDHGLLNVSPLSTAVLIPLARTLFARSTAVRSVLTGPYRRLLGKGLVSLVAVLLLAILIGTWSILAYRLTWPYPTSPIALAKLSNSRAEGGSWYPLGIATLITSILILAIRDTVTFLNLSSLSTFYAGRLRRAYLGAGNPARLTQNKAIEKDEIGDEIKLTDYYGQGKYGAPIHLINITLNQTTGNGSNIVQRDRHGLNIAIGPAGICRSGADARQTIDIPFDDTEAERLPLSTWIGISGAAFSTGLGARTGFGLSTVAGLANIRLGYWWRSSGIRSDRAVQSYLFDELLGRFAGTDLQRWYLSDGGHFENTGVYELIRRNLHFIVACDNGQDETYAYEDVANLVRKARIDFGAEIDFLDEEALDLVLGRFGSARDSFGTLSQIAGLAPAQPHAVAALAKIRYREGKNGTLVLIKPRLTGDGPADLIRYKGENSAFPQQSTLNQFFDEAQWESYYTLGRLITRRVMQPNGDHWSPGHMAPPPPKPSINFIT